MLRIISKHILWMAIILMFTQSKSFAATVDCLSLVDKQMLKVDVISPHYNNCFELNDLDPSKPLSVTVFSADKTASKLTVYGSSSSITSQKLLDKVSDSNGIMSVSTNAHTGKSSVLLKLSSFSKAGQNKTLSVIYTKEQSANIVSIIVVSEKSTASVTPPPPDDGGSCNPRTGICTQPKSVVPPLMMLSSSAQACSGALAPPAGMPENFNLEEHAAYFKTLGNLIDATSLSVAHAKAQKFPIVVALFAPHSVYDVKNGSVYKGNEVAGNYIFGYLGSAFGYSQTDLVRLGAIAQQFQNISTNKTTASQEFSKFYDGMKKALSSTPETGDNPGDSEKITNGQLAQQSGCNTNKQSNTSVTGSGGGGGGGSWGASGSFTIGGNVCYGNCYGTPRVTIKDL